MRGHWRISNPNDTLGTMNLDRITIDPRQMNGQPCIRGLRLTVKRLLKLLSLYPDRGDLRREFPEVDDEDIRQALAFAAGSMDDEILALSGPHEVAA